MREYGKVAPQFWTGETGKRLKAEGVETVIVAMYLMTCPHANMIGLYYLPRMYLAHETGLGMEGASKGLERCIEAGFCTYDEASEHVFVHAMARFQIAERLDPKDKRCKGVENELAKAPKGALVKAFRDMHSARFHLATDPNTARGSEGASKTLRSQEQEQEQEQEKKITEAEASVVPGKPATPLCPHQEIIALYHETLPTLAGVREWTEKRQGYLRKRWCEKRERQTLDWWRSFFDFVGQSDFLMGRKAGRGGEPFECDLEWLVRPGNFVKVIEGKYENRRQS